MASLSKLYNLKKETNQAILLYDTHIAMQQLALATPQPNIKDM